MANETGSGHRETAGHLVLVECHVRDSLLEELTASQSPT